MLQLKNINWNIINQNGEDLSILKNITIDFPKDAITVITGHNGSGKTSLAKIIMGIEKPQSGKIIFNDINITENNISERSKLGISYSFQQPVRFKGITVRDMLLLASNHASENELINFKNK